MYEQLVGPEGECPVQESVSALKPPKQRTLQVVLVEDDMLTATHLMSQFERDGRVKVVLWAASSREAIKLSAGLTIDIALVDIGLPDQSGVTVIEHFGSLNPKVDSLVLSTFGDTQNVIHAIKAGASGYLLKGQAEFDSIVDGLTDVAAGAASISPAIARHLMNCFRQPGYEGSAGLSSSICAGSSIGSAVAECGSLTPREQQMLKLVAHGYLVKEIAKKLSLSPHTVSTHFKNIYRKLHVRTRGEAVFLARQAGLI